MRVISDIVAQQSNTPSTQANAPATREKAYPTTYLCSCCQSYLTCPLAGPSVNSQQEGFHAMNFGKPFSN